MNLLLDTCTFLWYVGLEGSLPKVVGRTLREPGNRTWLSVVSFWEISVKHGLGRLELESAPSTAVPRLREEHRFEPLPLTELAVAHLGRLPAFHRDPFDRMLVCQAIQDDLVIVTPDPAIRAYPVKTLWHD